MQKLIRYFRGYVRVRIRGGNIAKLTTMLVERGLAVSDISSDGINGYFMLPARQYKRVRYLAKKCGCEIRVVDKRGLPFILNADKYLLTRLVGAAVFVIALFVMSGRVMAVEISGNALSAPYQVKSYAAAYGLSFFAKRADLDESATAQFLQERLDNLSWAAVNTYPFFAVIEMREKVKIPDNEYPAADAFIASRDGVITEIELIAGTAAVAVGQAVLKGDLLAYGGASPNPNSFSFGVQGIIRGRSEVSVRIVLPEYTVTELLTGQRMTAHSLSAFGYNLPISRQNSGFRVQRELSSERQLTLFGIALPITLTTVLCEEVVEVATEINETNAFQFARQFAADYASRYGANDFSVSVLFENERYVADVVYIVEGDIFECVSP